VCPHCQEEIREKSIFIDSDNYVYHRGCQDKGPIDRIKPVSSEEFIKRFQPIKEQSKQAAYKQAQRQPIVLQSKAQDNHGNTFIATLSWVDKQPLSNTPVPAKPMITFSDESGKTAGKWSYYLSSIKNDGLLLDMGQNWYITGLNKIVQEAQAIIDNDSSPITSEQTKQFKKNAQTMPEKRSGVLDKNLSGVDYSIRWEATFDQQLINVEVYKPDNMPDYLWFQVKGALKKDAEDAAREMMQKTEMIKSEFDNEDQVQDNWLSRASAHLNNQGKIVLAAKKKTVKPKKKTIDDDLLADGLGAFLDVFINYHGGPEGGKLAKWVIAVCQDPRFSDIALKLEQFHKLMGEIYMGILAIAKQNDETGAKVASILKNIKTS